MIAVDPEPPPRPEMPQVPAALKVSQLDALMLDDELAAAIYRSSEWGPLSTMGPHVARALALAPVLANGYTYGSMLQNLIPQDERLQTSCRRRVLYFVALLLGSAPQLWAGAAAQIAQRATAARLGATAAGRVVGAAATQLWKRADDLQAAAQLANMLVFLRSGTFRCLPERLLDIRVGYAARESIRNVNFEYMNHQLIWRAFTEFLLFLAPHLQLARWRRAADRLLERHLGWSTRAPAVPVPPGCCFVCVQQAQPGDIQSFCAVPHRAIPCGHVFCYYCIKSQMPKDPSDFDCPACGSHVASLKPSH